MRIGPHRQQIAAEVARGGQQPGADHAIDRLEHDDVGVHTVQREVGGQFRRGRAASLMQAKVAASPALSNSQ